MFIASMRDYLALKQIIKTLDAPRRQVYVEVTILEVETGSGFDLGTTFHGGRRGKNGSIIVGGVQHKDFSSADVKGALSKDGALGGLIGAPLEGAEKFLGTTIPSFGAFFQAMSGRTDLEVLSTPHILTANHKAATVSSGENIPYKAGVVSGDVTGTQPQFQPVQREKVALTLEITPHINASNIITLDVDLAMKGLKRDDFEGLGASWTEHSIKNTVMVHDQESVVIGGLVKESTDRRVSKVPVLGDIPLLGYLFRHTTSAKKRSNILVILTPHLVANNFDAHRIMQRRLRERREFLRSSKVLRGLRYRTSVNYGRKRGLVEEINQAVRRAERDAAEMRKLEKRITPPADGPVVGTR
jgi:general secretion pathway protein D